MKSGTVVEGTILMILVVPLQCGGPDYVVRCEGPADCAQGDHCVQDSSGTWCAPIPDGCVLICDQSQCGLDGCGGICGLCDEGTLCNQGACEVEATCTTTCQMAQYDCDLVCGHDCGTCPSGQSCKEGQCVCMPACAGNGCGETDGCGGKCTGCQENAMCNTGTWTCDCPGPWCGDACCELNETCVQGACSEMVIAPDCPEPVLSIAEGDKVIPQTTLHLSAAESMSPKGPVISWNWRVEQPEDNKFFLQPDSTVESPVHEANIVGTYTYCLDVCNQTRCSGDDACMTTACKTVEILTEEAIHIELTWKTPGDPDEYDEGPGVGSDMDLHFTHPFATGSDVDQDGKPDPWFDLTHDCFWFNPHPSWESMDPSVPDDPNLDRDDTDGAGPENLSLEMPQPGTTYRIGVHYWDDHDLGISYPRLKIYLWGALEFDKDLKNLGILMGNKDMWEVATVQWPEGSITEAKDAQGQLKITKEYMPPGWIEPGTE